MTHIHIPSSHVKHRQGRTSKSCEGAKPRINQPSITCGGELPYMKNHENMSMLFNVNTHLTCCGDLILKVGTRFDFFSNTFENFQGQDLAAGFEDSDHIHQMIFLKNVGCGVLKQSNGGHATFSDLFVSWITHCHVPQQLVFVHRLALPPSPAVRSCSRWWRMGQLRHA